jgi:hypothetical protein
VPPVTSYEKFIGNERARFLMYVIHLVLVSACGGTATDSSRTGVTKGDAGSGDGAPPSAKCELNSDCNSALICAFGKCQVQCQNSRDCPAGQRCVISASEPVRTPVCQLMVEAVCHYNSDCPEPLVCAVDLQCRNQCATDRDCIVGQRCVFGVCSDPPEINPDGTLKGATDAGAGKPGAPH